MFNRTPYNRLMYNSSGALLYGEVALEGEGVLTVLAGRKRGLQTKLYPKGTVTPIATKRTPGTANLVGEAILEPYGIRRQDGATLLKVVGETDFTGYKIAVGTAILSNTISLVVKPFKYGFAWADMKGEATISAQSGALLVNNAGLISSITLEAIPLKRLYEMFSLEAVSELTALSFITAIGATNLEIKGTLTTGEPFVYRWITQDTVEKDWDSVEKGVTNWETIDFPSANWKRVNK